MKDRPIQQAEELASGRVALREVNQQISQIPRYVMSRSDTMLYLMFLCVQGLSFVV